MAVKFHKMHGLSNDFVLLDLRQQTFEINATIARQLAERHTGIGCDQVLVLRQAENARQDASFEIWNSDGSRAEQCGNGVRCIGLYLQMQSTSPQRQFILAGPEGEVVIECLDQSRFRVDMGKPSFKAADIPIVAPSENGWYTLEIDLKQHKLGAVSMGNPHALMLVKHVEDIDLKHIGAQISQNTAFPEGCNAGFAEIVDRKHVRLRVFERGAAETLACGSGACAAMCILRNAGLVDETVRVTQAGGFLIIEWTGGAEPVIMTGTATHIFEGTLI